MSIRSSIRIDCGQGRALAAAIVLFLLGAPARGQAFELVHEFSGRQGRPNAGVVRASDGKLYGVLGQGGYAGYGSVYSLTPDGAGGYTYAELYGATAADDANIFNGELLEAADGGLYGTALFPDGGLIFRVDPAGAFTVVHRFPHGAGGYPSPLIQLASGDFYGLAGNVAFRMDAAGNETVLHTFDPSEGIGLWGPLLHASDGFLYGVCGAGGIGLGTVYRMDLSGAVTVLHVFAGDEGATPSGALIEGTDGFLYGMTGSGGAFGRGTVFRTDKDGTLTTLHSFAEGEGDGPRGALLQASDGNFYATTYGTNTGGGTLFRVDSSGALTTLHAFSGAEGIGLWGSLAEVDGQIVGTTFTGGAGGEGTVFAADLSGTVEFVYAFLGAPEGLSPSGGLIQASDGSLYGTCYLAGQGGRGTLFRLDLAGNLALLHSFDGPVDGAYPQAALIEASDGSLYGTNSSEGAGGHGTVFRSTTEGLFTTLHAFAGADGDFPYAALDEGTDGMLYGTTYLGGAANLGTAFRIDGTGTFATLHEFEGSKDGRFPSGLVQAADGDFYGTAQNLLFRMDAGGEVTPFHTFVETPIFQNRLLIASDGNFYGTSVTGVYRTNPAGDTSMLHVFQYGENVTYPGELIEGPDGRLYGTGLGNGENTRGCVFRVDLDGDFTVIHQFQGPDGGDPRGRLLAATNGFLYGTTSYGGNFQGGVVFRIDPAQVIDIASVSPPSGPAAGGTGLTIAGAGFEPGATVAIGFASAANVVVSGPGQILAASPALAPGAAYDVVVTNPDLSRTTRARAWVVDPVDVAADDLYHEAVRRLFSNGITVGCGDGLYCVHAQVSRAQAAVFILKSLLGAGYTPPSASGTLFADVAADAFAAAWIEDLAARGITAGCGGGNYCPTAPVTRAEMAPLLLKAAIGAGYAPPAPTGEVFGDVPVDGFAAAWIEDLAGRKIAAGCSALPALYCPATPTTRGQMAALLVTAFGLE